LDYFSDVLCGYRVRHILQVPDFDSGKEGRREVSEIRLAQFYFISNTRYQHIEFDGHIRAHHVALAHYRVAQHPCFIQRVAVIPLFGSGFENEKVAPIQDILLKR
jgi:hypothetical protein